MLQIDSANLMADAAGEKDGLTPAAMGAIAQAIPAAHQQLQAWRASQDAIFLDIVDAPDLLKGIPEAAARIAERFENLVVLGIGGSALGLRCAAQALLPPFWNLRTREARKGRPRLFVCDNIDPETFAGLLSTIDLTKSCFTVISKSGTTTETATQFLVALDSLKKAVGERWREHVAIITDPERGELRPMVAAENLLSFPIPPKLGGRFSVLSAVGLFPAACVGIDVKAMVAGAQAMARRCGTASLPENPAYLLGGTHHWFERHMGKPMSVMIPYADALTLASDWYAQLWAESLGKGGHGQTPVKALGATDQHSQVQLYMEGPKDKVFTFLGVERFRGEPDATRVTGASGTFAYLNGKEMGQILRAEQEATTKALAKCQRPSVTITFPAVDAQHVGEFFMLYEIATAFAGALSGINPFDQPGVELGKKLTREILSR